MLNAILVINIKIGIGEHQKWSRIFCNMRYDLIRRITEDSNNGQILLLPVFVAMRELVDTKVAEGTRSIAKKRQHHALTVIVVKADAIAMYIECLKIEFSKMFLSSIL